MSARDCIARIQQVAGRPLTDAEVEAVFSRIHQAALDIKAGRAQPADVTMGRKLEAELKGKPGADQARTLIQMAGEKAAADLEKEASLAEFQAHLQLVKMGARLKDVEAGRQAGLKPLDAVQGTITRDYSGKVNVPSMEEKVTGWKTYLERQLLPVWDSLGNDFLGFFQDQQKLLLLIRELRGESTGDAMARKGAEVYHQVAEEARQSFNENGGNIGKLDDWGFPQHHSQFKVADAGGLGAEPAKAAIKWVDDVLPMLDRTKYVDDLGTARDDAWMREFLLKAWETIATNGHNKIEPGQTTGTGKRANRHGEHRQIHFKDAESVLQYWETYGEKTAVEILHGHIETMARDIGMVEHFGPNPETTFRTMRDQALKDSAMAEPVNTPKFEERTRKLNNLWDYVSGGAKPSVNQTMSAIADGLANLNVAGKLGGAVWASVFGDKPMMEAVSHLNHLPMLQRWLTETSLLNPLNAADRRLLQQQGLMLEGIRSGLNRFYEGLGSTSTTGKIAGAVMRVSGMQAINDIRKGAFGASLMAQIGSMVERGVQFKDLQTGEVRALRNYGIDPHTWGIWSLAKPQDLGHGNRAITPEAINAITDAQLLQANAVSQAAKPEEFARARRDAIVKLLGVVNTESEFAVITPGWKERALFHGTSQRGTLGGELWRSWWQFKTFPWAAFQRSMDAIANADTPMSKALMTSWLIMATTLAGAMIIQVREMLAGKDPRPMFPDKPYDRFKFWGGAFLQGGALGIYGDFLNSANQSRYGTGPLEVMAGPSVGPLLSLGLVQPMNAAAKMMDGKETHLAAQTIQQLKGFVPGNNLWYTKAATEHLVWQRVMEALSPGYLSTMRSRVMKETGQDWWWQPGETSPERAPDMERAISR